MAWVWVRDWEGVVFGVYRFVFMGACVCARYARDGSRNLGRGGGTGRGWVREGDVPPPARSAEALSNIAILTHIHNEKLALIT